MGLYQHLLKPFFFQLDAEKAHHLVFDMLQASMPLAGGLVQRFTTTSAAKPVQAFGLIFPHLLGLAAGFDKNALLIDYWHQLGFSFVEIGTVTPRPQAGNDKPRLFRLPADQALINRMGFNNDGVNAVARRLNSRKGPIIIGGNIGKNKDTPNENAVSDYLTCLQTLHSLVDYFVVNVSSPNTPGLRALQDKEPLTALLHTLQDYNQGQAKPKPLLLKIAPDLSNEQVDDIINLTQDTQLSGLVISNTTISRQGLKTPKAYIDAMGAGGVSGLPARARSTEIISLMHRALPQTPIIGVGGIATAADTMEKIKAGATLLQVYTGYIYHGPLMLKRILNGLAN